MNSEEYLPLSNEQKTRPVDYDSAEAQLRDALGNLEHIDEQTAKLREARSKEQERLAVARDALQQLCMKTAHYLKGTQWNQDTGPATLPDEFRGRE